MRAALGALTVRGRCFLAAGVAAALCSLVLHERDLMRVAVFIIVLPLLSAAVVGRTRYRLSCNRRLDPPRVPAGQLARVVLRLENISRLPTGLMLLEDSLPYTLGGRPRFVLDRIAPQRVRTVSYPVRADVRGRYVIGPLSVRLTDPFGLVELTRSFSSVDHLTVTPVVTPLPHVRLGGEWLGGGDSRARSVSVHGEDDAATREYRFGDDLRKVHWRSTARVGELMVRREEQPWQSRAAIFLDTRAAAHRGDGPGSSFEWSVSAAASVATQLGRDGFSLRLLTDAGIDVDARIDQQSADSDRDRGAGILLDHLAEVTSSRNASLATAAEHLRRGPDGLTVAVLGRLDAADAEVLASARTGSSTAIAVLIDTASWLGLSERARAEAHQAYDTTVHLLIAGGWRVLEVRHGESLAGIWQHAGRHPFATAAAARIGAR